ncbi:MAG: ABC transporter permease [Candidatus Binatia bacterium]|nr:ABC transporter permease [Candidatus Binatia bacterium]
MGVLKSLVENRALLLELVRRDIRSRFVGARFGLVWSLLNPAIQLASYTLIFGYLYAAPVAGDGEVPFIASLFCGLWPWWGFNEGVMRGLSALVDQGHLLRKVPIPPSAVVVAAVTASIFLQLVGFLLFLAIFGAIGLAPPRLSWLGLPVVVVVGWLLTTGLALVLAPLYLVVRDTLHVVAAVLTIGFFVSPVLYASDWLPEGVRGVASLNPLTGLLGLYRTVVLGSPWPSGTALGALVVAVAGSLLLARILFSRLERLLDEYW